MNLNLYSSDKLDLLCVLKKETYGIERLFRQFFKKIDIVTQEEQALQYYREHIESYASPYDIVIVEHENEHTFELIKNVRKLNETQLITLLLDENQTEALKRAIRMNIDSFVLTPLENQTDIIKPILKLVTMKYNELDLQVSNYLIEQKDKIIDENVYMTIADLQGNIVNISRAYSDFTGYSKDELIGKNHNIFRNHNADPKVIEDLWNTITAGKRWQGELKNNKKNGQTYIVNSTITPLHDPSGRKIGYLNIISDITEIKRLEELSITDALTKLYNRRYFDFILQKEFRNSRFKGNDFALFLIDVDFFKNYNDFYGHAKGDEALKSIALLLKEFEKMYVDYAFRIGGEEFALIALNKSDDEVELIAQRIITEIQKLQIVHEKSAISKHITASVGAVNVPANMDGISSEDIYNIADNNLYEAKKNGRNLAVCKRDTTQIGKLKDIDTITKLPNRAALLQDIALLQEEAMLVILHINQIQALKELYGSDTVHEILKEKAHELLEILKDNAVTLYSLNMQEFAILITERRLFNKYLELIRYLILSDDKISAAMEDDSSVITNFTAGIAYGIMNIFNNADTALQEAILLNEKYVVYDENDPGRVSQKSKIDKLKVYKKALLENNIIPFFQPIIDTKDNSIHKYEALARIRTADGEIISPVSFLDAAKMDKTYEYFSRQLMQKVFNIYAKNDVEISLNVTYENITSSTMLEYIENRLQKFGGENITFEIVETEEIKEYKRIEDFILMVKKYGAKVSIDDFGSGYSNFTNIIKLNIDYIKLDGSLTQQLLTDKNVENMVKAIISFAKEADIKIIAEYISTPQLDKKVKELGVDFLQGYLYGEPKLPQEYGLLV